MKVFIATILFAIALSAATDEFDARSELMETSAAVEESSAGAATSRQGCKDLLGPAACRAARYGQCRYRDFLIFCLNSCRACYLASGCRDTNTKRNCDRGLSSGLCTRKPIWAQTCRKTCGLCGGGNGGPAPNCKDERSSSTCARWMGNGWCEYSYFEKKCKKTCDKC